MVMMYLMSVSSLCYEEALAVVQYCRQGAFPNMGFCLQLKQYCEDGLEKVREGDGLSDGH